MLSAINIRNVRSAYVHGIRHIVLNGIEEQSRNGPVLVLPGPLVTTYAHPTERVLLDPLRDANPFFHLLEAFWMLAGRRDVESLMRYNAGMQKYSDDGETFHGAYGHRWRHQFGRDQLDEVVRLLRANPADRRVVISMWDSKVDLGRDGLDFPCNTQIYLRVRDSVLDLTVTCRSNDMVWGGYGANAVHFSVLQEFLAAMIGVGVGRMYQLSNNAHVYRERMPAELPVLSIEPYGETIPLFGDLSGVSSDVIHDELCELWGGSDADPNHLPRTTIQLVHRMRQTWDAWKARDWGEACRQVTQIPHPDWQRACSEWLARRFGKFAQ